MAMTNLSQEGSSELLLVVLHIRNHRCADRSRKKSAQVTETTYSTTGQQHARNSWNRKAELLEQQIGKYQQKHVLLNSLGYQG